MSETKKSQASTLVELAQQRYRFAMSTEGKYFAVAADGPNVARMLRGGRDSLRAELAMLCVQQTGAAPTNDALATALLVLQGHAMMAPREQLHLRFARAGQDLWIDVGDETGRAIRVTPGKGWKLHDGAPMVFQRSELTEALPEPEPDGDLEELHKLLNVSDEGWDLARAWMVAATIPDQPTPILLTRGLQGTGKSTHAQLLAELIDPSAAPLRSAPRDLEQWSVAAAGSRVVAVDNLSHLSAELSDALCRAVTGDALVKRELYSDGALFVLRFQRAIILTSIDMGALRGDLADRLVILDLLPIAREQRRLEREIREAFQQARPRLLGALLDLVSSALAKLPAVELRSMERMADFCRLAKAVDEVLTSSALAAYETQRASIAGEVVAGDQVARRIAEDVVPDAGNAWEGSATDLLAKITPERPPKGWPTTPHHLSGHLRRAAAALADVGVHIEFSREGKTRSKVLRIERPQRPQRPSGADSNTEANHEGRVADPNGSVRQRPPGPAASAPADAQRERLGRERPDQRPTSNGGHPNSNGAPETAADAADAENTPPWKGQARPVPRCPICHSELTVIPDQQREVLCLTCRAAGRPNYVVPVWAEAAR